MRLLGAYLLLIVFSQKVSAQQFNFNFTNYTTASGLPYNSISCVIQDTKGFLWIGTGEGLSRYDGKVFKNYFSKRNNNEPYIGNSFYSLKEYQPQKLLFSSNGKLTSFNTITERFEVFKSFKNKTVYSVNRTSDNWYLMSCVDTCYVTDNSINITNTIAPPFTSKNKIVSGFELENNTWLIGNESEYFIYDVKTKKLKVFNFPPIINTTQLRYYFNYYNKVKKEFLFSNFFNGIYKLSITGKLLHHYKISADEKGISNSNIAFINKKNDSIFWIGTLGGGLHILNERTNTFEKINKNIFNATSLPDENIVANFTDNDKNEWLATTKGLAKINTAQRMFKQYQTEKLFVKTSGFLNIKKSIAGEIFVSCLQNSTIYKVEKQLFLQPLQNIKTPTSWCLNNFGSNIICLGGGAAYTVFDPITFKYKEYDFLKKYFPQSDVIILALKQSNGDEWYSGNNGGGFVRVRENDKKVYHYRKENSSGNFTNSYYSCYAEDENNDLWFGVNKSSKLLHWKTEDETFEEINLEKVNGITGENFKGINDIVLDKDQNIWIAFDGNGIVCYNHKNKSATNYTIENGLPTNYISALQFDGQNRLWMGTVKGLSCFHLNQKRFDNFLKEDGLPDDNFTERCILFDSTENKLWVGTNNALFNFNPNELLANNKKQLPVYIDRVIINGNLSTEKVLHNYKLYPTENNIQFYFIAVSLNKGKDIEYSYKLDDADKDWVYNGDITNASYANLQPGKYTFNVRAKTRGENVWTTLQAPLVFTIKPHWWQTWAFIILSSIGILILIFFLFKIYFKSRLQKEKNIMEKELAIEQERNRMARDLHDGLGSMLSGIKHSFSAIKNELNPEERMNDKFDSNINKLDESIIELRNISHSITSEMFLKHGLENSIMDYCNSMNKDGLFFVSFKGIDLQNISIHQDQAFHIFRIIQELLQNTSKHAAATQALVQLSFHLKKLYLTVEDDGLGYDKEIVKNKKGIGLKNVEARVKILKGKMDIKSAVQEGTSVFIEIPISNKA